MSRPTPAEVKALAEKHGLNAVVCLCFDDDGSGTVVYGKDVAHERAIGHLTLDLLNSLISGTIHCPEVLNP